MLHELPLLVAIQRLVLGGCSSVASYGGCSWLQIPRKFSRKLSKLATAVLTRNLVLNPVLTAVNRVLKKIGCYCSSGWLLYREVVRLVLYIEDGQSVGVADTIINMMALLLSLLIDFYISWKNSSKFKSMIIVIYSSVDWSVKLQASLFRLVAIVN